MKKLAIAGLTMLFVGVSAMSAVAEKIPNDTPPNPSDSPGTCPAGTPEYKQLSSPTLNLAIPDGSPTGVTTPPLQFPPDGTTLNDVLFDIGIVHTWIGDLNVRVSYDHDCSPGTPAFGPVSLMCRQQLAGCPVDMCCGCSGDLVSAGGVRYRFGLIGSTKEIAATGQCPTTIPGGCYRHADESAFGLSVFSGLRKDGCWTMFLQDGAGADVGTLQNWIVYMRNNQTTAVEPSTWGAVKAGYAL